jgi:hypothetical protein
MTATRFLTIELKSDGKAIAGLVTGFPSPGEARTEAYDASKKSLSRRGGFGRMQPFRARPSLIW